MNGPPVGMSTKLLSIYVQINLDFVCFFFGKGVNKKVAINILQTQKVRYLSSDVTIENQTKKLAFFLRAKESTVFLSYFESPSNSRMKRIELLKRHL